MSGLTQTALSPHRLVGTVSCYPSCPMSPPGFPGTHGLSHLGSLVSDCYDNRIMGMSWYNLNKLSGLLNHVELTMRDRLKPVSCRFNSAVGCNCVDEYTTTEAHC